MTRSSFGAARGGKAGGWAAALASAAALARFTDCLCFFAELRCNLVGLIGRSDKKEAARESRKQTEAAHADCQWLSPQLELLFQTAAQKLDTRP